MLVATIILLVSLICLTIGVYSTRKEPNEENGRIGSGIFKGLSLPAISLLLSLGVPLLIGSIICIYEIAINPSWHLPTKRNVEYTISVTNYGNSGFKVDTYNREIVSEKRKKIYTLKGENYDRIEKIIKSVVSDSNNLNKASQKVVDELFNEKLNYYCITTKDGSKYYVNNADYNNELMKLLKDGTTEERKEMNGFQIFIAIMAAIILILFYSTVLVPLFLLFGTNERISGTLIEEYPRGNSYSARVRYEYDGKKYTGTSYNSIQYIPINDNTRVDVIINPKHPSFFVVEDAEDAVPRSIRLAVFGVFLITVSLIGFIVWALYLSSN